MGHVPVRIRIHHREIPVSDQTNRRYSEAVCRNYERLLFKHGPSRLLPDSAEDLKWQQERDELCAKAHRLALAEVAINAH